MHPRNFPGRKNDRRKGALSRLNESGRKTLVEKSTLIARILPDDMARSIRTKKDRSSRARVRA